MKTSLLTSVGQPTSGAYKLSEAGVPVGSKAKGVEFVVGARPRSQEGLRQTGCYHIAFCSSVMRPLGHRLYSCAARTHSGGARMPQDTSVNSIDFPTMELAGAWKGQQIVLHGYALVSRNGPFNQITFDRIICAEALDLSGTGFDGDHLFEREGGVQSALESFALFHSGNPRIGTLLNRNVSAPGVNCRRLQGSATALFRAGARQVITVDRSGRSNGRGELDLFPISREILQQIPARFLGPPAVQSQREEVFTN